MIAKAAALMRKLSEAMETAEEPPPPEQPTFKKKCPEIPTLECYRQIPEHYWSHWPRVEVPTVIKPIVNVASFYQRCIEAGVDRPLLDKVTDRLEHGAEIGARGAGRAPAIGKNHNGFYAMGPKSMDCIAAWLKASPPLMAGPLRFHEFNNGEFRGNPLQATPKVSCLG